VRKFKRFNGAFGYLNVSTGAFLVSSDVNFTLKVTSGSLLMVEENAFSN